MSAWYAETTATFVKMRGSVFVSSPASAGPPPQPQAVKARVSELEESALVERAFAQPHAFAERPQLWLGCDGDFSQQLVFFAQQEGVAACGAVVVQQDTGEPVRLALLQQHWPDACRASPQRQPADGRPSSCTGIPTVEATNASSVTKQVR